MNDKSVLQIAGYGNSNLIKYNWKGGYFLDKISEGLWQLEVFPDAFWIKDPFGKKGNDEPVAKLKWKDHLMQINIKELNSNFNLLNENGDKIIQADNFTINIQPGRYFITNDDKIKNIKTEDSLIDFNLIKKYGSFISDLPSTEIKNKTPETIQENETAKISAEVYSNENNLNVYVYFKKVSWRDYQKEKMITVNDINYECGLPDYLNKSGLINYFISIEKDDRVLTFPGGKNSSPNNWDFNSSDSYSIKILPVTNEEIIYDPIKDKSNLIVSNIWRFVDFNFDYAFDEEQYSELSLFINKIKNSFPELALQIFVGDYTKDAINIGNQKFRFEIKNINEKIKSLQIRFLFSNGSTSSTEVSLTSSYREYQLAIPKPDDSKYALLPRPYPLFQPYWFSGELLKSGTEKLKLESIQIAIPLNNHDINLNDGIKIKKIKLIKSDDRKF